jgi:hypothetical protein
MGIATKHSPTSLSHAGRIDNGQAYEYIILYFDEACAYEIWISYQITISYKVVVELFTLRNLKKNIYPNFCKVKLKVCIVNFMVMIYNFHKGDVQ